MVYGKKFLIWDLDDTLYLRTPEWADMLDTVMAEALVWDLKVPMSVEEAKQKVTESYTVYRNGGEIFIVITALIRQICFMLITRESRLKNYGLRQPAGKIEKVPAEQYIFTASDRYKLPKRY
ncbi:MAG: hypothetical protein ACLU99_00385 [Alphaproteobacteria bacterium]